MTKTATHANIHAGFAPTAIHQPITHRDVVSVIKYATASLDMPTDMRTFLATTLNKENDRPRITCAYTPTAAVSLYRPFPVRISDNLHLPVKNYAIL